MILISFGNSWEIFKSGNTLGCVNGLENSSNDNAWGIVLMPNFGVGVSGAVDFVGDVGGVVGVVTEFTTSGDVGAVAIDVWVGDASVVVWFNGLTGETGLARLVGLVTDLVHVLLVVIHVPLHVGWP